MKEYKEISGIELQKGKYYLRVFTDIYDDMDMHYVRRGVDFKISGLMARSLKAVFKKLFNAKSYPEYRTVNGLPSGLVKPLKNKRYRADINCCVSRWNGEKFELIAGFTGY